MGYVDHAHLTGYCRGPQLPPIQLCHTEMTTATVRRQRMGLKINDIFGSFSSFAEDVGLLSQSSNGRNGRPR